MQAPSEPANQRRHTDALDTVYVGRRGHAAVDRELYVPHFWTSDPDRCLAAGLGKETSFATKPELAARMVARFLEAGHRAAWVAGDEVYGGNPKLRGVLEERGTGYVLAVACSREVTTSAGKFRADALAKKVPKRAWQKLSAGTGPKGHRFYDWAAIDLADTAPGSRQLLIRRNRTTGELAYYRCYSPHPVLLAELVRVAGSRWRVEEFFQAGKGLAALDEHQVRRYASWSRWVTLAMLAHAFPPSSEQTNTPATPHRMHAYRAPATRFSTCSSRSSSAPPRTPSTGSAGPTGDAVTKTDPRPATTGDKPLKHEDHDLRLESLSASTTATRARPLPLRTRPP
ncbi:SRSO17 transposase [Streptomyces sp. B4I13]|nr:SRSO17 transposase [Streptomyces sp. B4I13]